MITKRPLPVVGIVGAIGSGKSAAAAAFERLGLDRIDADRLAHDVLREPSVVESLRERFGQEIFDPQGELDRAALGAKVFRDAAELEALEAIVHPRVRERIESAVAAVMQNAQPSHEHHAHEHQGKGEHEQKQAGPVGVVIDAPLLLETGLDQLCDVIVVVLADEATRQSRVRERNGWDHDELARRELFQKPLKEKIKVADYRIDNDHSIGSLEAKIESIWSEIVARSFQ